MKIFDKKSPTKIEEDDLNDANLSVADFPDEITKKRAFINVLGARLAMKLFFSQKIEANNLYSLYTIHSLLEEFDIADIYYKNIKIDVRMIFNKDEIFIPKAQFEYELLPDLYAVLHLTEDMSSVEFLGFFEPKDLNKINANKDFYFYEYEYLQTPDKLKAFLDKFVPQNRPDQSENNLENAKELFLSLVDKEISQTDKKRLLKSLANDFSLREQMVEFENFETISKTITNKEELFQDELLDFAGTEGGDNLTLETASEPVAQEGEEFDFKKADEFSEEEINAWASDKTEEPIEEKINEPTVEATEEPIAQETEDFIFENANESIEEVVNDLPIETTDAPIAQEIEDFIFETENEPITQEINEQTFDTTAETIVQETEEFIFETQNESIEEEVNDLTVEPTNEPIVQEISNLTVGTTDEPIAKGLKNLTFETTNKSIAEGAEDLTFEKVGELFSEEANDLPFDKEDEPIEEGLKRFLPNVGLENELINKELLLFSSILYHQ